MGFTYDDRHALTRIEKEDIRLIRGIWLAVRHDELDAPEAQELTVQQQDGRRGESGKEKATDEAAEAGGRIFISGTE